MESGVNSFVMSSKQLIERTNAIGIRATPGCYGGTYAHTAILLLNLLAKCVDLAKVTVNPASTLFAM
jgi:hypothetical protein